MKNNSDFYSTVLASSIHDIKNSLGMLLNALEDMLSHVPQEYKIETRDQYSIMQYESSRLNTSLMQLLALYKMDNDKLPFHPNQYNLHDFIEEQILIHSQLIEAKGFNCEIEIDDSLEATFDEVLLSMVISNIIGNSIRYAKSAILITATQEKILSIEINDDGPGYPQDMLKLGANYMHSINQSTGSTGLGLYFAEKVAHLHRLGETHGKIELSNGGKLGGGLFKFSIP